MVKAIRSASLMRDDKSHKLRRFGKVAVGGGLRLAEYIRLTSTKKERFAYFVAQDKVSGSAP